MIKFSVRHDIERLTADLTRWAREQIPFAASQAINDTAIEVRAAEVREMRDVFDRPTPYTLNSVYVKFSSKQNLRAEVGLKDDLAGSGIPATKFMAAEIRGGGRQLKRFEVALYRIGVLPEGYRVVPGAACPLDAYGNAPRGLIVQVLSYFRTFDLAGFDANMSNANRARFGRRLGKKAAGAAVQLFVGRPADGKLPLGIWQRTTFAHGSALKPLFIFVPHAQYHAIYDFVFVAQKTVERMFADKFRDRMAGAMLSAKI